MDKDKGKSASEWRTSTNTFLAKGATVELGNLERRVAELSRVPLKNSEQVQVLHYDPLQKYDSHHDYFDPAFYGSNPRTMAMIENGKRNRLVTAFFYLSTVQEGGETHFPRSNHLPNPPSWKCHPTDYTGIKVEAKQGRMALFYNLHASGRRDEHSLHGGCPVLRGEKWAANYWIWNRELQPGGHP